MNFASAQYLHDTMTPESVFGSEESAQQREAAESRVIERLVYDKAYLSAWIASDPFALESIRDAIACDAEAGFETAAKCLREQFARFHADKIELEIQRIRRGDA